MGQLVDEHARLVSNENVGPRLHLMRLEAPVISNAIKPGQFIHMKVEGADSHILRRPFSVYAADTNEGILDVLYQEVGSITKYMPTLREGFADIIGPIGNTWMTSGALPVPGASPCAKPDERESLSPSFGQLRALVVGGGVGAAPLFMLTQKLHEAGCALDVVLGAQTEQALVCRTRYEELLGCNPLCATDDGTYGRAGFCTSLVQERLAEGSTADGKPYDFLAVCGPEPLMKIVAGMALEAGVPCEVSMEKRMACGVGACLSCVVDTVDGKRRSCVDGPIFDARKVVW